jgi:hypothetical protein
MIAMNSTTEKLQRLLAENPRGLLYLRDELAGWFGGFDRYGGKGEDRAFFLETWNAGAYVCDRVKDEASIRIEHALLAIIGGMVPDRLRDVLSGSDDGLVARVLFVWSELEPIASIREFGATDAAERRVWLRAVSDNLRSLPMGQDSQGQPAPIALRLDAEAFRLFDEQRRDAMQRSRSTSGIAAGWYGKNPGRLLRLALVFELLSRAVSKDNASEVAIVSADSLARAGAFLDYAAEMLERVLGGLAVGRAEVDAAQIARHVLAIAWTAASHAQLEPLNERSLYQQRGFGWARVSKRRQEAFKILTEAGWIRQAQTDVKGRPRGDWSVNPRILEATP